MARSKRTAKTLPPKGDDAPMWIALAILAATALIFLNRPFHIDDPLFIWAAKQIQAHPGDPYGFTVNWYGREMAMSEVTKNPPLASYYIAGMASMFGWREAALHLAFLLPALAAAAGIYAMAKRYCATPALATLAAVVTPVFFVSSVTVMCDVMMLACWVWAVHLWRMGVETKNHLALGGAAVLIAAASLSKYFGMALIPLLLVYSLLKTRRIGWWIVYFAIPIAVLAWYQRTTNALYGRGLLLDAAAFATQYRSAQAGSQVDVLSMARLWVTLTFTGGCVATLLCFAPRLWSRLTVYAGIGVFVVSTLAIVSLSTIGSFHMPDANAARWLLAGQVGLWGTAGISLLLLAGLDVWHQRDADAWLLLLWTLGTFAFAGFVNWSTNARSILPLVVPAGILIVRRIERTTAPHGVRWQKAGLVPLAAAAMLSMAVTGADTAFAEGARTGAAQVRQKYPPDRWTVWFQGHWGFQYYMEQLGGKALDDRLAGLSAGDLIVVPSTAANIHPMGGVAWARPIDTIDVPLPWLATMNLQAGAGFYADVYGPLPFAFGRIAPERFTVYKVSPRPGPE